MELVAEVFTEVQESTSVSSKQVYTLLEQYEQNRQGFLRATEQCYLKILKAMLKAPRKIIEKYEKLTEKLFETAYRQYAAKDGELSEEAMLIVGSKKQRLVKKDVFVLFQHFLSFFSRALDSTQLQIRVFSARIVFILLKILPAETLVEVTEGRVARQLILGTLSLMKEKKGNLKQIGIKITSYLQKLMDRPDLAQTQEAISLKSEMMRSMCMDDQDQIRKLALINLEMNEMTFPHLIKRIRDKNPEIRATVFKKLIKEQIPLANLNLSDIYKLIYDGLGSREATVRDACTRYLALNYCLFKEESQEKALTGSEIEVEEDANGAAAAGEDTQNRSTRRMKRFFTPNKESTLKEMKIKIINFLQTFEIEKSLYYPELYESLEMLVKEAVKSIFDADGLAQYLKDVFMNQLSLKKKKKHTAINLEGEELFLVRIVCGMVQNPEERALLTPEIVAVVEDCFPNGIDFSQVLIYFAITQPGLFSLHQVLLTSEYLINCDEAGRNKLQETLKYIAVNMSNSQLISDIPSDPSNEYNDIFYELDPENVKNNIFSQSYFQSPIITCSYELLPIVVRILKKVVSDGHVNVQLIQLISEVHEPLAKDADNDSHFDLPSDLERIQRSVRDDKSKLEAIDRELAGLKKNKLKQKEIYDLERDREERVAHLKIQMEKEEATQMKIFDISMRELILVQSLLANCKVDPKDNAISNLLQSIIMPGLNSADDNLVSHSLKSLALFVLIDRNYCNDFFSVFQELLMKNDNCQTTSPSEIISLRSIVDFILLYDLSRKSSEDEEDIDIPFTQDLILRYAFQADTLLRTISIEGLSKLLFNGKLQDPQSMICLLMVIWFDTRICQKEGFKAVQILSTLFKTFTASSLPNLSVFERALELFSLLIVTLDKRGLVFNDEFVIFDHLNENFTSKALRVGINLMSYEYHKTTEALTNLKEHEFCPQERFFIFLAHKCSKDRRFQSLFEKVTPFFDFYARSSTFELKIILKFLRDAIDNCTASKQLHIIEKQIQDRIKLDDQKKTNDLLENEDGLEAAKIAAATAAVSIGSANAPVELDEIAAAAEQAEKDAKLFSLSPRQLQFCERLAEQIENNLAEMDVILKNLTDSKIVVQDTLEKREHRHRLVEEEDEENFREPEAADDGEEDITGNNEDREQDVKPRRSAAQRAGRRKAAAAASALNQKQQQLQQQQSDEEIEVEEEQEEQEVPKGKRKRAAASKKQVQKHESEDNDDEDDGDDSVNGRQQHARKQEVEQPAVASSAALAKGRSRGRAAIAAAAAAAAKIASQKVDEDDDEDVDDDGEDEIEDESEEPIKIVPAITGRRGSAVPVKKGGRKNQQQVVQSSDDNSDEEVQVQEQESDDDDEDEVEEEVVVKGRKGGKQVVGKQAVVAVPQNNSKGRSRARGRQAQSQEVEDSGSDKENSEVQEVVQEKTRARGRGNAVTAAATAANKKLEEKVVVVVPLRQRSARTAAKQAAKQDSDNDDQENQDDSDPIVSRRRSKENKSAVPPAKKPVSSARRARK